MHRKSAQGAFCSIVRQAVPSIIDESGKPIPASQHVVDWLGD
jgi:hypothetical protein